MITQPDYEESQLKAKVEEEYGFSVQELKPVPWGESSWGYAVEGVAGEKYFLKVHPNRDVPEESLHLTERLFTQCHLENTVYPIPTKSEKLKVPFGRHTIVLFNFVAGENSRNRRLTIDQFKVLGRILAKLHHSTSQVGDYSVKERYEIPFVKTYQKLLKEIGKEPEKGNEPQKELKNLLKQHIPRLEKEMYDLQVSCQKAFSLKGKFVICHGDLTPGNILVTPTGDLCLADWDEPILAPKERDLVFLAGPKMMFVMQGYRTVLNNQDVDDKLIAFYQHRRNVSEIVEYAQRVLHSNADEAQSWHDLDEMILLLGEMGIWKRQEMKKR
jgi:spectinomycin phosphotransferase